MAICPKCLKEFQDNLHKCPECKAKLVSDTDLVEAFKMRDTYFAGALKDLLTKDGIPCSVRNYFANENMLILGAKPEIGIRVPGKYLARAKEIYNAFFKDGGLKDDTEYNICSNCECALSDDDSVCPCCGERLES